MNDMFSIDRREREQRYPFRRDAAIDGSQSFRRVATFDGSRGFRRGATFDGSRGFQPTVDETPARSFRRVATFERPPVKRYPVDVAWAEQFNCRYATNHGGNHVNRGMNTPATIMRSLRDQDNERTDLNGETVALAAKIQENLEGVGI